MRVDSMQNSTMPGLRWLAPALLLMAGGAALWIDIPVAEFARQGRVSGQVKEVFENLEPFGHGAAVAVIALAVCCLRSHDRMRHTLGVVLAAFGSGLAANLLKLAIHRERPWQMAADVSHGLETFGAVLTELNSSNGSQSFPSAHAATAMGLATALAVYYPRGRFLFYALAGATAVSRVIAPSHFVSDTLVGLALGSVVGQFVVRSRRFSPLAGTRSEEPVANPGLDRESHGPGRVAA